MDASLTTLYAYKVSTDANTHVDVRKLPDQIGKHHEMRLSQRANIYCLLEFISCFYA